METNFEELMASKSDEGLQEYIDNRLKFVPQAIEAAISEFQKRGHIFNDEELLNIRQDIQNKQRQDEQEEKEHPTWGFNNWKKNVVEDINAPAYYSEWAIYMFSMLFSVLFGAVLLASNLRNTKSKKGIWQVLAFGIFFIGLQIWLLSLVARNSVGTVTFGMIGGLLLNYLFWNRYIGKDTKYRTKSIWLPLIIGALISIPFILAIIYGGAY